MSDETKNTATEENSSDDKQEQSTVSKIEVVVEVTKDKKEAERPGVCCGECS